MTQEEKARAYDKALERARKRYNECMEQGVVGMAENFAMVFPELAESGDERIRRKMIEHFKAKTKETWCNMPVKDIIAYLEKQKEPENTSASTIAPSCWEVEQKEQKPEEKSEKPIIPEWSEEALNVMNLVYRCIRKVLAEFAVYTENEELLESREETVCYYSQRCAEKILKSLRPSWKPSEDELTKKHLEGYIKGRNDALREMSDYMESHFNTQSGTSTATLHDNTSVTDGKPHNPSFTD